MEFLSLFETSEAFTQTLMMTLPSPRFEAYQNATVQQLHLINVPNVMSTFFGFKNIATNKKL